MPRGSSGNKAKDSPLAAPGSLTQQKFNKPMKNLKKQSLNSTSGFQKPISGSGQRKQSAKIAQLQESKSQRMIKGNAPAATFGTTQNQWGERIKQRQGIKGPPSPQMNNLMDDGIPSVNKVTPMNSQKHSSSKFEGLAQQNSVAAP